MVQTQELMGTAEGRRGGMASQAPSSLICPSLGFCQHKQRGFPSTSKCSDTGKDYVPDFNFIYIELPEIRI